MLDGKVRPRLAAGVRLQHGEARGWVLLAPERVVELDGPAPEILRCCDGERDLAGVVAILAERFAAPADEIMADVAAFLDELRRQHLIVLA